MDYEYDLRISYHTFNNAPDFEFLKGEGVSYSNCSRNTMIRYVLLDSLREAQGTERWNYLNLTEPTIKVSVYYDNQNVGKITSTYDWGKSLKNTIS